MFNNAYSRYQYYLRTVPNKVLSRNIVWYLRGLTHIAVAFIVYSVKVRSCICVCGIHPKISILFSSSSLTLYVVLEILLLT